MGNIAVGTVAGLAVLVAIVVIALVAYDWNGAKPTIEARLTDAVGRPVRIVGDLDVSWLRPPAADGRRPLLPWPRVIAHELTIANPEWSEAPNLATVERVAFFVSPWQLLARKVSIPRIDLAEPAFALERDKDGRDNWTFEDRPASDGESAWRLEIGELAFDRARIAIDDRENGSEVEFLVDPLGRPVPFAEVAGGVAARTGDTAPSYVFGWEAKGRHRGLRVRGNGQVGGLLAFRDDARPFPVQADVTVGSTRIALAGTLTDALDLAALDLDLRLSGASMSELYPVLGVTLPDTPPYYTDGRLVARLREAGGPVYRYEEFTGRVGKSDLRGSLTYVAGEPRPRLSGTLGSRQLRFVDLGPLIGVEEDADGEDDGEQAQPPGRVLPVQEFRTDRWRAMDADVRFQGKRILRGDGLPLTDVDTHLVMEDGVLRLAPLRFGMAGGRIDGEVRLDGSRTPLAGRTDLQARDFALRELFPEFEPMQASIGELNGDVQLAGQGNSVAALLGSADGELRVLVDGGTVSRGLMELVGLNVGNYIVTQFFGDDAVRINCAVADMRVADGVMEPRLFLFDTENAQVRMGGSVNLREERLQLDLHPRSKGVRLLSLRSPLYVRGTFADPEPGVHAGPLAARGAGMLALGAAAGPLAGLLALIGPGNDDDNPCAALLRELGAEDGAKR